MMDDINNKDTDNTEELKNKRGGPNTPEGKAISSLNARKHGLTGRQIVMPGEDPDEYEALQWALADEHQPLGATETILVHDLGDFHWLTGRAIRLQANAFLNPEGIDGKYLALMIRYQNSNHHAFHKTLKALQAAQKARLNLETKTAQPPVEDEEEFVPQPLEPLVFRCSDPNFVYPPAYAKFLAEVDAKEAAEDAKQAELDAKKLQPKKVA
jgi:hypothetical protein